MLKAGLLLVTQNAYQFMQKRNQDSLCLARAGQNHGHMWQKPRACSLHGRPARPYVFITRFQLTGTGRIEHSSVPQQRWQHTWPLLTDIIMSDTDKACPDQKTACLAGLECTIRSLEPPGASWNCGLASCCFASPAHHAPQLHSSAFSRLCSQLLGGSARDCVHLASSGCSCHPSVSASARYQRVGGCTSGCGQSLGWRWLYHRSGQQVCRCQLQG